MTLRRHHHRSTHTHSHVDTSSSQSRQAQPGLCQQVPKAGPDDEQIVPPLTGLPWLPVRAPGTLCPVSACCSLALILTLSRSSHCLFPSTNCVHVAGINTQPLYHSFPPCPSVCLLLDSSRVAGRVTTTTTACLPLAP